MYLRLQKVLLDRAHVVLDAYQYRTSCTDGWYIEKLWDVRRPMRPTLFHACPETWWFWRFVLLCARFFLRYLSRLSRHRLFK